MTIPHANDTDSHHYSAGYHDHPAKHIKGMFTRKPPNHCTDHNGNKHQQAHAQYKAQGFPIGRISFILILWACQFCLPRQPGYRVMMTGR